MPEVATKDQLHIMTPGERAVWFNCSRFVERSGLIEGIWNLGANFKKSNTLHGSYLGDYLDRVLTLFADIPKSRIVHLYAGMVERGDWYRVDIQDRLGEDDSNFLQADIEQFGLKSLFAQETPWERDSITPLLWIADPPYWDKDAEIYNCPPCRQRTEIPA